MHTYINGVFSNYAAKRRTVAKKNLSDKKLSNHNIKELLGLQQAILDSANYSIIATTVDGVICAFNAMAEKWLGYSAEEMIGKQTPACFHDILEIQQRAIALTEELGERINVGFEVFVAKAKLGEIDEQEWTYIRKDGSRFPVMLSISVLRNDSNEISGFLGVATDITERKQLRG